MSEHRSSALGALGEPLLHHAAPGNVRFGDAGFGQVLKFIPLVFVLGLVLLSGQVPRAIQGRWQSPTALAALHRPTSPASTALITVPRPAKARGTVVHHAFAPLDLGCNSRAASRFVASYGFDFSRRRVEAWAHAANLDAGESWPQSTTASPSASSNEAHLPAGQLVPAHEDGGSEVQKKPPIRGGFLAAGAVASTALILEVVKLAGTAVLLWVGQHLTGTGSPVMAVAAMIAYVQSLGLWGYGVFAAAMITAQVVPIASAFPFTLSAGAIFGAVKGTFAAVTCSTISAVISFGIARTIGRSTLLQVLEKSKQFIAMDKALGNIGFRKSLTLITLLRLSPALPFEWANYLFGLSPVSRRAFFIGSLVGCTPSIAAFVSAGQVGADVMFKGVPLNPVLVGLGGLSTVGALAMAGNIAAGTLKDLNINLDGSGDGDDDDDELGMS